MPTPLRPLPSPVAPATAPPADDSPPGQAPRAPAADRERADELPGRTARPDADPADEPIAAELAGALEEWHAAGDKRALRRALLGVLAELE